MIFIRSLQCEVLQAKLSEKEKEVEDHKLRIRELEQLLFSRHSIKHSHPSNDQYTDESAGSNIMLRPNNKVIKQYSQDEGRSLIKETPIGHQISTPQMKTTVIPDLKITRPSETSDDESDSDKRSIFRDNCIKTSKLTGASNTKRKTCRSPEQQSSEVPGHETDSSHNSSSATHQSVLEKKSTGMIQMEIGKEESCKVYTQDVRSSHYSDDSTFSSETSVDQQILFRNYDQISLVASFKDELYLNDSFNLNVPTIPEENEEEGQDDVLHSSAAAYDSYHDVGRRVNDSINLQSPNSMYRDLDPSDQEVRCLQSRVPRSTSASGELHQITRGRCSRSKTLDLTKLYSSLEGVNLDAYDSDSGINFRRLGSTSSCFSDETASRRNSWNWDSEFEGDSEEEGISS